MKMLYWWFIDTTGITQRRKEGVGLSWLAQSHMYLPTVPHIQSVTKQWDDYYNNRYTLTACTYTFMYYMAPFSGGLQISHISWIWGLPRKLPRKLADILSWHRLQTEEKIPM